MCALDPAGTGCALDPAGTGCDELSQGSRIRIAKTRIGHLAELLRGIQVFQFEREHMQKSFHRRLKSEQTRALQQSEAVRHWSKLRKTTRV